MSIIMHIDMDAFYASVELRRRPELKGKPVMVGGSTRGVVLSATYPARERGVRSGMPMTQARRLCPKAIIIQPDFDTYAEVSKAIVVIFESVTAVVESASIDEAFLDITGSVRQLGPPSAIGEYLRAVVADEQQITCSVGIGPTKFIAKLASQAAKPDGLREVPADDVISFLHPLPVEAMWGVGESTSEKLHRLGLFTVAELAHTSRSTLQRAFGVHQGALLSDLAWGRDHRGVVARAPERSVGSEETFGKDTDDPEVVKRELLRMSARTAYRLRKARMMGRTISISIRFADFTSLTRSVTVTSPTDVTDEIHHHAVALYEKLGLQRARIRRVGVRVEGLVEAERAYRQPELTEPDKGWREAEQAMDAAIRKFGPAAVQRAALTRRARG
ncbi:DNA polymerase IV [Microlunatus panaciterrae]|uniref:DNA polymerase IV n=1 Tax=Microlunatus panaciterrae TaxID=400768 RepID=A0ABS2RPV6_9ACTN|nr:DNA polymerase IV [Microlunatus panaciterrae]MBM7800191.1 DNA polymerase-4 [Microlunatus panaciterrae]